jgi:DNA transformation protein and related proteins
MAVSSDYLQYVLEQLSNLGGVTARRMFGGVGLSQDQRFFGIITSEDTLYFKVNDGNREDFVSRGMKAFQPPSMPKISMSYFEVPADVLEDPEECVAWAKRSVAAATVRTPKAVKRATKSKPRREK